MDLESGCVRTKVPYFTIFTKELLKLLNVLNVFICYVIRNIKPLASTESSLFKLCYSGFNCLLGSW